jgi:hypothetical protein
MSCQCCGLLFPAVKLSAKWCSNACRQWAYHQRKRTAALVEPEGLDCRTWQGTAIERRQIDGFVNATAICQANGRRWAKYAETERCREYIAALKAEVRIPDFAPVLSQRGGAGAGGQTWIHPSLAIDLARWISPAFAVWMDGWFLETVANPQLPHGVHVVASNPRHAAWLWAAAVEAEVGRALMGSIITRRGRGQDPDHYQLHLLPA